MTPDASINDVAFVVLHHLESAGGHYDLMIDLGEKLATWRCPDPPDLVTPEGIECVRIGDHRRAYLTYEGPLSGGRGTVWRYDEGACHRRILSDQSWLIEFVGRRLSGKFLLRPTAANPTTWTFTPFGPTGGPSLHSSPFKSLP